MQISRFRRNNVVVRECGCRGHAHRQLPLLNNSTKNFFTTFKCILKMTNRKCRSAKRSVPFSARLNRNSLTCHLPCADLSRSFWFVLHPTDLYIFAILRRKKEQIRCRSGALIYRDNNIFDSLQWKNISAVVKINPEANFYSWYWEMLKFNSLNISAGFTTFR